jgi:hypothetical protein
MPVATSPLALSLCRKWMSTPATLFAIKGPANPSPSVQLHVSRRWHLVVNDGVSDADTPPARRRPSSEQRSFSL